MVAFCVGLSVPAHDIANHYVLENLECRGNAMKGYFDCAHPLNWVSNVAAWSLGLSLIGFPLLGFVVGPLALVYSILYVILVVGIRNLKLLR